MKTKNFVCLGILMGLFLVFWTLANAVQAAEKKEITMGYAVSMTGMFAHEGNETQRGYQLWLEQTNKAGGLLVGDKRYPVKFIAYDDESDASKCAKLYEKLITRDNVDLVLAPFGSGNTFAASAVTEKHRYPLIVGSASATKLFERGFKYIFGGCPLATTMVEPWLSFLEAYKNDIKTVAILYENFLFTVSLNESLSKFVQQAGAELLLDEKYPIGGKDFAGLLLKVKGLNPDALFILNLMPASLYATRQAYEVGVTPKLFFVNIGPIFKEEFTEALGDLSEKIFETGFWHPDLPYPGTKEFVSDFQKKFNRYPSTDAVYGCHVCQMLEQAIKKEGTINREKLANALREGKFETVAGPYQYDERGVNKFQRGFLVQVQKKERVIVWPKDLALVKPQFMR